MSVPEPTDVVNDNRVWVRTHEPGEFTRNPTERQLEVAGRIRTRFRQFKVTLMVSVPNCRERSLAITHLEDACNRAIQAVMYHRLEGEED